MTAKVLAPAVPPAYVERPLLEAVLDGATDRRLTLVIGGPGWGKSTLLAGWASRTRAAWYSLDAADASLERLVRGLLDALRLHLPRLPADLGSALRGTVGPDADDLARADAFVAALCEALAVELHSSLVLVLDDLHEVPAGSGSARLVEGLCRQAPPTLHVVAASRTAPPFPVQRMRGQGLVAEIEPGLLTLSPDEVGALLTAVAGPGTATLAKEMYELTGGWAAAVRLAAEALRGVPEDRRADVLAGLGRPGGPLLGYLVEEVLGRESAESRELLRVLASLGGATAGAVAAPAGLLADLARRGLLVESGSGADATWTPNPAVRDVVRDEFPLPPGQRGEAHARAAAWYAEHGRPAEALRCLAAVPDPQRVAEMLAERGPELLRAGEVAAVERAAEVVPPELRDARVDQVLGEARQVRGDWHGALESFRRAAGDAEELDAGLAWRMGLIPHLRGEIEEALAVFARGRVGDEDTADEAQLLAWTATSYWLRGDFDRCRELAERAGRAAERCGDPGALAAAHTILAMQAAVDGDRRGNDAYYLSALHAAERAGDVLQIMRIRSNRGSHLIEEGYGREALVEIELAARLAEMCGYPAKQAIALHNRGEAHLLLGHLEEAAADFEQALRLYQRIGSRMACYPLGGLGRVRRERGELALARAAYEESLTAAEESGDVQGLGPALAGLARVRAADDMVAARELAERAVALGENLGWVEAHLARGWVALAGGDRAAAAESASIAAAAARQHRDRPGLADSLALQALLAPEPAARAALLDEAATMWHGMGAGLGEATVRFVAARLAGPQARAAAEQAEAALRAFGVRPQAALTAGPLAHVPAGGPTVSVYALGAFRVLRAGAPVPVTEWQSKKARDLLKLLVARRGRPVPRELLMETLWPEEDPKRLGNRLSVALSTVRSVLDPERRMPGEGPVVADRSVVWLDLAAVAVDVEAFLADAAAALEADRGGREADALLSAAAAAYGGEFLEEDPYEEWAVALREEARAAYVAVVRALARRASAAGDADMAVRYALRLVEQDRYDEEAHLGLVRTLVAAGRHGEAHRRYQVYATAVAEIGVEAAPFPAVDRRAFTPR